MKSSQLIEAQVIEALTRMERGRYRVCPRCRRGIPFEHLLVMPATVECGVSA